MKKSRLFYIILALLFGAFMFVYGEYDDSPGGQLLGLLIIIISIISMIKSRKKAHGSLSKKS
ncbi:hypothetical protein JW752_02785 [Candidatus Peregrinibacteria bacterium]|nr:hypothetical protein [Candidatus Peregrinibacteria bacterium]